MTKRNDNMNPLADEYGELMAKLAKLIKRQKGLKKIFEEAGIHALEGELFRIVGSTIADSVGPDWEKIAYAAGATDRQIDHPANQKVTRKGHYRVSVNSLMAEEDEAA